MKERTVIRAVMFASLVGVGLSAYLTYLQYQVYSTSALICTYAPYISCDVVLRSQYSAIILGIPNAIVAIIGFGLIFTLGFIRLSYPDLPWSGWIIYLMTGLSAVGAVIGTYLTYVSSFIIHAICPYCLGAFISDLCALSVEMWYILGTVRAGGSLSPESGDA